MLVPAHGSATVVELHADGHLVERSRFEGHVADEDFARAEEASGLRIPPGWRRYLQRPSWLARGWLSGGGFVSVCSPARAVELTEIWVDDRDDLPPVLIVGGDLGGVNLVVDVSEDDSPVLSLPNVCDTWEQHVEQAADVGSFIAAVEDGSFTFRFE